MSVTGKFVKVPKDIATGRQADGTDLMAADKATCCRRTTAPGSRLRSRTSA